MKTDSDDEVRSLRDWLAGLAMQGYIANSDYLTAAAKEAGKKAHDDHVPRIVYGSVASSAYDVADAMLRERSRRAGEPG